jgi:hypothetical protein
VKITLEHLKKREDESFNDYHIRLYENKEDYNIDKFQIAELLNDEMGSNYDESKWRKDYAQFKKWEDFITSKNLDEEIVKKHEELRLESEKEKYRKQDQKREYRKLIRNSARFEKIRDDIVAAVRNLEKVKPLTFYSEQPIDGLSEKHGLALFSDWHFGMEVDTNINRYNKDIFNRRVEKLVKKVIEYGKKNEISTLHIGQLGDILSGNIHVSTRVQSNEDLIEQIKYVSEILAEILNRLAYVFPNIKYYNVIGNHARAGKKSEVGINENFEYLVAWFLETRLRDLDNVEVIADKDGYVETKIFDKDIIFVHGNFDQADKAVARLPQMLGYVPDFIIGGHVHHNYLKEFGKTTTIVNGSLIGNDDYATQGRYGAKPSQKFMVFDERDGLECEYIIKFDDIQ